MTMTLHVLALALAAQAAPVPAAGAASSRPRVDNVLFIVIDTLRADHLGCYGYPRATSPNIDRFAASAVRFERASCAWPETCESMAAMLSGTWCQTNGVVARTPQPISAELDLLPEILSRAGFRTAAVVDNDVLARKYGFDQGSDLYFEAFASPQQGARIGEVARSWVKERPQQRFFLWLHFIEPHAPYEPREPERFVGDAWYDGARRVEVRPPDRKWEAVGGIPGYARIEGRDEFDYYVARYDSEIVDVDERVMWQLRMLRDLGLEERTLVVIVSDHGEGFGEHDYYAHGLVPFEENAHLALLMRVPGVAPGVVPDAVSTVDLAPTILELLGLPPVATHEGRSLVPQLEDPALPTGRPVFVESGFDPQRWQRSVRDRRFKLVHVPTAYEREKLGVGPWSLFDLDADPRERRDVLAEHPDVVERLKAELAAWKRDAPLYRAEPVEASPEELERLRKLGYASDR